MNKMKPMIKRPALFILLIVIVIGYYAVIKVGLKILGSSLFLMGLFCLLLGLIFMFNFFIGRGLYYNQRSLPPIPFLDKIFSDASETNFLQRIKLFLAGIFVLLIAVFLLLISLTGK